MKNFTAVKYKKKVLHLQTKNISTDFGVHIYKILTQIL